MGSPELLVLDDPAPWARDTYEALLARLQHPAKPAASLMVPRRNGFSYLASLWSWWSMYTGRLPPLVDFDPATGPDVTALQVFEAASSILEGGADLRGTFAFPSLRPFPVRLPITARAAPHRSDRATPRFLRVELLQPAAKAPSFAIRQNPPR